MKRRVKVVWTVPARNALASLSPKIRHAILEKTRSLANCNPKTAHKRLAGPLSEYYSIRVSRYRAIYRVDEERLTNGDVLVFVRVLMVAAGMRKAGDRRDIYRLAERLIRFAAIEIDQGEDEDQES